MLSAAFIRIVPYFAIKCKHKKESKTNMRIIHLISGGDVGGAKTHVHLLLQGLKKTEYIKLVCFTDGQFVQEAVELGIPTQVIDEKLSGTLSRLQAIIEKEKFEIIHCHGARANLIGMLLKKRVGLPVVTTMHSDYRLDYLGRPLAAMTYGTINKIALRRLDNWIGVSDATANMLISRNFDPQRVFKLYNSVRFDDLTPALSREEFFEKIGLSVSDSSVVFGIAARINPVKDMETLIRAFARTVAKQPDVRLVIAGEGEQRAELEQLAAKLCPEGSCRFCGWLDDVDSFYNAIDVNMLTSLSEGFPYALPEGGKMHCATIASRVGGVPELIEHELNGLLFEPKDLDTLAEHMLRLAVSPKLRRTFADRLFERVKDEFSLDAMLANQKAIYNSVLRQHRRQQNCERDGIILCGAYGKGNIGDETILTVITSKLLQRDPDMPITVLSRSPEDTKLKTHVNALHTFDFFHVHRAMKKSALYLSGGGSLIQDATSTRSLLYYLQSIRDAKKRGCKVMMFGCGIGPVSKPKNRRRAAKYIGKYVDKITLRDEQSMKELQAIGVKDVPVRVTADMALLLEPASTERVSLFLSDHAIPEGAKYLLIAPRPWQGVKNALEAFADAAQHAYVHHGLIPVLFAMEPKRDRAVCEQIAGLLQDRGFTASVIDAPEDAALCIGVVRHAGAVLSMRLHTLVFAAGQAVPCAGVVYDPKVSGFMQSLGSKQVCMLEDASSDRLCELVDSMMDTASENEAATLRKQAEENVKQAFSLLLK